MSWDPWEYRRKRHPDVDVVEWDLPAPLQGCVDHQRRIIWLTRGLTPAQARSVLAYELAQLELGPTPADPCVARAHQKAAEEWAALMLISTEEFVEAWAYCLDLQSMAERCGVDLPTWRARIRAASDADQDAAMSAIVETRLTT